MNEYKVTEADLEKMCEELMHNCPPDMVLGKCSVDDCVECWKAYLTKRMQES